MKVAKKVIGIAIAALLTVAFCWAVVNGAWAIYNGGRIKLARIIQFAPAVVAGVVVFIKALIMLIRSFKASEFDYSYHKDCVRILKKVIMYFVVTAICNVLGSFLDTAKSAANSATGPSQGTVLNFASNLGLGIFMIILSVFALIFTAIGVGKRADDKPVRKVPVLIGVAFLLGCIAINNSYEGVVAVTSTISYMIMAAAILVAVLAFMKPEKQVEAASEAPAETTEE